MTGVTIGFSYVIFLGVAFYINKADLQVRVWCVCRPFTVLYWDYVFSLVFVTAGKP